MQRRLFLQAGAWMAGVLAVLPQKALAAWPTQAFKSTKMQESIKALYGTEDYAVSDAVLFKAPEIAENGAVVPISVKYDGPVKNIAIFVEENPAPLVSSFDMSTKSVANISTRIKMGKGSKVHAIVQTADGKLIGAVKEVKVTIGGCGG
ncbi:thiosulfate oxidation carrier protein SoxY [Candidatus Persebacteraceae bacterium Df01]|jgi:sulfur-oxidizing protein SoxY|uniref:Thiosulfate oxidation carrier protein SoxY n=1 Tax=Candidatus Doriopsillibacter californiensis TaxID=2970740 RepID=A0ABT7QJJ4_9GAMM|nr:thiosulfate oxidation carrier protein SoxY [Candidatus Persebacteraceae bacterium Df01]